MESLFDNAFFQLPLLEGAAYASIVLLIGAALIGLWDRVMAHGRSEAPRKAPAYEDFRQAA
jgi:hypothetical protein